MRGSLLLLSIFPILPTARLLAQAQNPGLRVPPGFQAQPFAEGLAAPTAMAFAADGWLCVAVRGAVIRLSDTDADGQADRTQVVVAGIERPNGLAWRADELWVTDGARLSRVRWPGPATDVVSDSLPGGTAPLRTLLIEPSGAGVFVTHAPVCRLCKRDRGGDGGLYRFTGPGQLAGRWARGLGPSAGMAIHPETGELWVTGWAGASLGDELPPDELNIIRPGGHYGWPFCYAARMPYPDIGDAVRCAATHPPVLTFPAGSFPLGLTFYSGGTFPPDYRGDAFVALAGSGTSRSAPRGYKVIRVRTEAGRPVATVDFVTGWVSPGGRAWGRPIQPLVGPGGALYVSDDLSGRIWRITYRAPSEDEE